MPDPVTDYDLDAYVDDQLDPARRMLIEEHLSRHPETAARVMADLRSRSALHLLAARPLSPAPHLAEQASSLVREIRRRPLRRRFGWLARITASAAVGLAIVALAIGKNPASASVPDFVADAVMAHRTALIRATMLSQPESQVFDAKEILRGTQIRLPELPIDWRVSDVQVFPSDEGPSLQLMIRTGKGVWISVFAVHQAGEGPARPTLVRQDDASVAYWRRGDVAYAVTGAAAPHMLELAALDLADNRFER